MKTFPMFIKLENRRVIIVGGEEEAAQKTRLMLKTEAKIVLAAKSLNAELIALRDAGKIVHYTGKIDKDFLTGAALAFVAIPDEKRAVEIARMARATGVLVNTVDLPDYCDAYTPSLVDRDPVVVAIGTEGMAPVLAQSIKTHVDAFLEPNLGQFTKYAGSLRDRVAKHMPAKSRRHFWSWVFRDKPRAEFANGNEVFAQNMIENAIMQGFYLDQDQKGSICVLAANRTDPDLISLRAVKRLQDADIILYNDAVEPGFLELARRDAKRINVGSAGLPRRWSQERIKRLMQREASKGSKVVYLSLNAASHNFESSAGNGLLGVEFIPCIGDKLLRGFEKTN